MIDKSESGFEVGIDGLWSGLCSQMQNRLYCVSKTIIELFITVSIIFKIFSEFEIIDTLFIDIIITLTAFINRRWIHKCSRSNEGDLYFNW